jgi:hypothetical protein
MTPEEEIRRAERARQLLEDSVLKEALQEIESQALDALERCPIKDIELRERLWMLFCTTRQFRNVLKTMIDSGKLAAAEPQTKIQQLRSRMGF